MDNFATFVESLDWEAFFLDTGLAAGRFILILVLACVVWIVIRAALKRLESRMQRRAEARGEGAAEAINRSKTLTALLRQGLFILVLTVVVLMLLKEIGVEIAPILASAGILGLAVGFGAQNLVRDVISGFFVILENQVSVGDVAVINGTGGVVEEINFRTLVLRDLAGVVHVFPNGTINTLANLTRTWSGYVFDIGIAYKEDPDRAMAIMREVGEEMQADDYFGPLIVEPLEIFGVDQLADSAVVIKGRLKTRPIKQWEVGREFLKRIKKAFDENGIEIPFPHRTFYFGEASPPLVAQLERAKQTGKERPQPVKKRNSE